MVNIRNFIPKRKYRERGQVSNRDHLGILEKKKDYKIRAKNFQEKRDKLNALKSKARLKN